MRSALFKLCKLGVTGSLYNLLQSYLSGRSHFVRLRDRCSDHLHTNCDVPQGSVLGLLHFVVYVNDFGTNITSSISVFADDAILLCSSKNPSASRTTLSNDLRQLGMWFDLWSVTFNAAKTQVLPFTNNPSLQPPLQFCNQALTETVSHAHLGLIFHEPLTWYFNISTLHHGAMSTKLTRWTRLRTFFPGIHFLSFIMHVFCPSLTRVLLFRIPVRLLTPIFSKAFKLLQLNLSSVVSGPYPTRLF